MKNKTVVFLATAAGTGNIPLAGGTLGSIEGALISLILNSHLLAKAFVFAVFLILGTYIATQAEHISGIKDERKIVIDEAAGAIVATFFLPIGLWPWVVTLISYRFFDWLKPFPIRRIERLTGGFGVVGDDLCAGLYSLAFTWIIYLMGYLKAGLTG